MYFTYTQTLRFSSISTVCGQKQQRQPRQTSSVIGRETGSTFSGALVNTTWLDYWRDAAAVIRTYSRGKVCHMNVSRLQRWAGFSCLKLGSPHMKTGWRQNHAQAHKVDASFKRSWPLCYWKEAFICVKNHQPGISVCRKRWRFWQEWGLWCYHFRGRNGWICNGMFPGWVMYSQRSWPSFGVWPLLLSTSHISNKQWCYQEMS